MFSLLLLFIIIITSSSFIFIYFKLNQNSTPDSSPSILNLIKNKHRILEWSTDLLKSNPIRTVSTPMGIITADPKVVEHFLKTRFDNYPKGERFLLALRDFLGSGIFNSDGDLWKSQRKTASLEFKTKTIRSFIMSNVMVDVADRLIPMLSKASANNKILDLQEVLFRFAFDNVCKVVFSWDPARLGEDSKEGRDFNEAFEEACALTLYRFQHAHPIIWKVKRALGIGSERKLRQKIEYVQRFAMQVVNSRKAYLASTAAGGAVIAATGDDLLSRFMADGDGDYSDEFLRDVVLSFVLAGRDTTSATLAWFFWLISRRQDVKKKIEGEISKVKKGKWLSLDEVREMDYMHAVLSETLRLYPAIPLEGRTCAEDDVLPNGMRVRKGEWLMYNSYAMGRMKEIWGSDWNEFKPDRWMTGTNGEFQQKSPFEYPVFNAGPRTCLGKEMAYIQMKVAAASMIERFEIDLVDEEEEKLPEMSIIMKMKGGLNVRVREKKNVVAK